MKTSDSTDVIYAANLNRFGHVLEYSYFPILFKYYSFIILSNENKGRLEMYSYEKTKAIKFLPLYVAIVLIDDRDSCYSLKILVLTVNSTCSKHK